MIASLHENDEILVVDKPAGLPAQPGEGVQSSVISVVERDYGFAPYPVHRLDKETAGCMILAKSKTAAARWSAIIESREVGKRYRAICSKRPLQSSGRYVDPIPSPRGLVAADTSYRLLAMFGSPGPEAAPEYSYLEYGLGSGRMHQIRRHSAMHGHPILGDDKYGDFALNRALSKSCGLKRLMLWAWRLDLPGIRQPVISSLPPHFAAFLAHFPDAPDPEVL